MKNIITKILLFTMILSLAWPQYASASEIQDNDMNTEIETDEQDIGESDPDEKDPEEQDPEEEDPEAKEDYPEENLEKPDIDETDTAIASKNMKIELNDSEAEVILEKETYRLYPDTNDRNYMMLNSYNFQVLVNAVADAGGGTVQLPVGEFYFYPIQKNFNKKGSILTSEDINYLNYHIIKCRDNVTISGTLNDSGELATVLRPISYMKYPVDMFYYADIIDAMEDKFDTENAKWLTNADFKDFTVDFFSTENYGHYNAKGKAFYFVLLKDCDWFNVKVKNTDGTGFGVDCPINCTMKKCTAIACGKQANTQSVGASGFGIGFGYSEEESMLIEDCVSIANRKFGYFFENQARFEPYYQAETSKGFVVKNCVGRGSLYNFGGEMCSNTYYIDCVAGMLEAGDPNPMNIQNKTGFYFGTNSKDYHIIQDGKEINVYAANKGYYKDVHGWFVTEGWLEKILLSEIMYGYTDANGQLTYVFGQEDKVSRGQVAVMLYRYANPDQKQNSKASNTTPFIDNHPDMFYTAAMNWAYSEEIFTGYKNPDGTLSDYIRPEGNITREELATVLYRFAQKEGADVNGHDKTAYLKAPDVASVSAWATDAISWCYGNKVMSGNGTDGCLNPANAATRGQAAKMILQMLETIDN